jgi:hypothetical protein
MRIENILRIATEVEESQGPWRHPKRTEDCLSLGQIRAFIVEGLKLSAKQMNHVRLCYYCGLNMDLSKKWLVPVFVTDNFKGKIESFFKKLIVAIAPMPQLQLATIQLQGHTPGERYSQRFHSDKDELVLHFEVNFLPQNRGAELVLGGQARSYPGKSVRVSLVPGAVHKDLLTEWKYPVEKNTILLTLEFDQRGLLKGSVPVGHVPSDSVQHLENHLTKEDGALVEALKAEVEDPSTDSRKIIHEPTWSAAA